MYWGHDQSLSFSWENFLFTFWQIWKWTAFLHKIFYNWNNSWLYTIILFLINYSMILFLIFLFWQKDIKRIFFKTFLLQKIILFNIFFQKVSIGQTVFFTSKCYSFSKNWIDFHLPGHSSERNVWFPSPSVTTQRRVISISTCNYIYIYVYLQLYLSDSIPLTRLDI